MKQIIKVQELKSLTGLRGLAALWVVFGHFSGYLINIFEPSACLTPLWQKCHQGVDIFFVLSGFILAFVYLPKIQEGKYTYRRYLLKRVARVYPNHIGTLLLLTIMVLGAQVMGLAVEGSYGVREWWLHIFMLHALPVDAAWHWNYPSWSISAEFFAYLFIFPFSLLLTKASLNWARWGWVLSFLMCGLVALVKWGGYMQDWWYIIRVSMEFMAGFVLYLSWRKNPVVGRVCSKLLLPYAVLIFISCFVFDDDRGDSSIRLIMILSTPLIIAGLASGGGFLGKILSTKVMCYLGIISYALYMTHALVLKILVSLSGGAGLSDDRGWFRVICFISVIMLTLAVAALTYHFWEEPMRRRIQRLAKDDRIKNS